MTLLSYDKSLEMLDEDSGRIMNITPNITPEAQDLKKVTFT